MVMLETVFYGFNGTNNTAPANHQNIHKIVSLCSSVFISKLMVCDLTRRQKIREILKS